MDALEHRYVALSDAEPEDMDEHLSEISSAQYPIVMKISATRAATIHGLRAKAASLLLWAPDLGNPEEDADTVGQLTWSILRDLVEGHTL